MIRLKSKIIYSTLLSSMLVSTFHVSETATTNLGWLKVTKALIFVSIAGSILFMFYSQAVDFVTDIFDFSK